MSVTAKNLVFSRDASTSKRAAMASFLSLSVCFRKISLIVMLCSVFTRAPLTSFLSLFSSNKTFLIVTLCSVFTLYKSSTMASLLHNPSFSLVHNKHLFSHCTRALLRLVSCPSLLHNPSFSLVHNKHLFSHCTRAPLASFLSLFASH